MSDGSFKLCNPNKPQRDVHFCQTSITRQKATILWKTWGYLQGGSVLSTLLRCFEGSKEEHLGFFLTVWSKGSWVTDSHPHDVGPDTGIVTMTSVCRVLSWEKSLIDHCTGCWLWMSTWKTESFVVSFVFLSLVQCSFLSRCPKPEKWWNDIKSANQYTQNSLQLKEDHKTGHLQNNWYSAAGIPETENLGF